jgi:pantoate--beta-alanine ligase
LIVASTRKELAAALDEAARPIGVVMTMGALHAGHAELLRQARSGSSTLVATIFVNPLQFGPREDLSRYPRTLDADLELCRGKGVDIVFTPPADEVYPGGTPAVQVAPGPLATVLEGASRPGHFDGVLTVVLKLLHLTRADRAYYGEKDYQQLALITAMVRDLDVPAEIIGVPTVRDPDGLALSSRNRYLSPDERTTALALSRALQAGAAAAGAGADAALAAASAIVTSTPGLTLDYLALTDPQLGPPPVQGPGRLLVAARVGTTRLIDNAPVLVGGGADMLVFRDGSDR